MVGWWWYSEWYRPIITPPLMPSPVRSLLLLQSLLVYTQFNNSIKQSNRTALLLLLYFIILSEWLWDEGRIGLSPSPSLDSRLLSNSPLFIAILFPPLSKFLPFFFTCSYRGIIYCINLRTVRTLATILNCISFRCIFKKLLAKCRVVSCAPSSFLSFFLSFWHYSQQQQQQHWYEIETSWR